MTEVLLALVSVLNVAVGALALQLRRNGKKQGGNNDALHDVVTLLYAIDGKLDKLVDSQASFNRQEETWHTESRQNYKEINDKLGDIPKRRET